MSQISQNLAKGLYLDKNWSKTVTNSYKWLNTLQEQQNKALKMKNQIIALPNWGHFNGFDQS